MEHPPLTQTPIHYLSNFDIFSPADAAILCSYRLFIEKIIIRLGEDWRIESNLLAEEIVNLRKIDNPNRNLLQFNIFN
jgi:hypothetical protein